MNKIICLILDFALVTCFISACQNRKLEYGRIGRDTVYVVGNGKIQICHVDQNNRLIFYQTENLTETLLSQVTSYKSEEDKLFVVSDDGYAVVDEKTYKVKLLIFNPSIYFDSFRNQTNRLPHYSYSVLENTNIELLNSFDEFSETEQKCFLNLSKMNSFDSSLMGEYVTISIQDEFVDAEWLKKIQNDEELQKDFGFELVNEDLLGLLIKHIESNNLTIVPGNYTFNRNWAFDNGKMVTHAGEFVDVFEFCEIN